MISSIKFQQIKMIEKIEFEIVVFLLYLTAISDLRQKPALNLKNN